MLRPSRPMIRPFMSSDESSTTVTVVSAVWLAATRCERVRDERARAPAGVGARLFLHLADIAGQLVPDEILRALEQLLARLAERHAGDPLQLVERALLAPP